MQESWKDITEYEGLYQVSNFGRVKSLNYRHTRKEKLLKPFKHPDGYLLVHLYKERKNKYMLVHRLVAQAFLQNPYNLQEVNHIDEDKTNNNVTNLEWCTREYNINYGTRNERISKKILCIETGVVYPSIKEVERQLGFLIGNIWKCCNKKRKTAYKFHWKYVD